MTGRGIIMAPPMALGARDGTKRVTRRLQAHWDKLRVGDTLYVRESLRENERGVWTYRADGQVIEFEQGDERVGPMVAWAHHQERGTCPGVHMPRWAARTILRVTEPVRVERLQVLTEDEAQAEGIEALDGWLDEKKIIAMARSVRGMMEDPRIWFAAYWDSLAPVGVRWQDNPLVRRIAFERAAPTAGAS